LGNIYEAPVGQAAWVSAIVGDLAGAIASQGFADLAITILHAQTARALPGP
jgi:hypothetical protein